MRQEQEQHLNARHAHRLSWLGVTLLACAVVAGLAAAPASAATSSTLQVACGNVAGPGGLIADIQAANASTAPSTIVLPKNCTFTLTTAMPALSGKSGDSDGLPPITARLTINGNGSIITRSQAGTPAFRILEVAPVRAFAFEPNEHHPR
jgi:hypothetical protein